MPTFALEKQTHLQRKEMCFILTLPVAGAVAMGDVNNLNTIHFKVLFSC